MGHKRYELKQFHFHIPSEHTIDGRHADMVIHLVHADKVGNLAVVAVQVNAGRRRNAMLQRLWEYLPRRPGKSHYHRHVGIQLMLMLPPKRNYFAYTGSLTEPPCTEGVRWFVLKTPLETWPQLIRQFHEIVGTNIRPLQARNARVVFADRR